AGDRPAVRGADHHPGPEPHHDDGTADHHHGTADHDDRTADHHHSQADHDDAAEDHQADADADATGRGHHHGPRSPPAHLRFALPGRRQRRGPEHRTAMT